MILGRSSRSTLIRLTTKKYISQLILAFSETLNIELQTEVEVSAQSLADRTSLPQVAIAQL